MYRLDVTAHAELELDRIVSYIAEKLVAPQAAVDFVNEVYACYERLEENPFSYEECRSLKLKNEGYRRAIIKNYIMLYKIYESTNKIIVHRFFYGGQDCANLI
ncbi:MAG: type II toxin-antitoxin system RelE/ParE family toxin [Oscillospiraceae bacterium]|nr:type II toxin-antitoxin system RelE/ParE family toxin [Oscillospiraceae bacterium]